MLKNRSNIAKFSPTSVTNIDIAVDLPRVESSEFQLEHILYVEKSPVCHIRSDQLATNNLVQQEIQYGLYVELHFGVEIEYMKHLRSFEKPEIIILGIRYLCLS